MVCVIFFINKLLAPNNPNAEKLSSYECGEEPTGNAWLPFNPRFYVIALVFLLFDVEMVFIFPWATVFGSHELAAQDARWGWVSLTEMFMFLGILIIGLIYVWRKGDLDWIKPTPVVPHTDVHIPPSLYQQLNQEQSMFTVKAFNADVVSTAAATAIAPATAAPSTEPARKPMFKPTFKKPANE
ncbi:NADH-quinone oxidoreductase subunit A [Mucilaginibacter sp. cycad4]|uniref:NADH-quinone oxidoreductase subunit A n=1 Tax=Mucilaginibacter sp. cycad4 TaxID=3342096 RepID=UPI002AAAC903|nr:NADH-quinone oxidoreductase subunit A [Mucilaginibacter gossypii]WPV02514.1 NADH-quinone oxidoreductase subunit A [Mucilaginibacter gossypii]